MPLAAALALGSCSNECEDCNFEPVKPRHSRILFHYLAMDNDLWEFGRQNVLDMVAGATEENMDDGAIVVFSDMPGQNSRLLYIKPGVDGVGQQTELYDWGENLDASDPETFMVAFDKVRELMDADSWALGAGSHGTGWAPYPNPMLGGAARSMPFSMASDGEKPWYIRDPYWEGSAETRAVLKDNSNYMEIGELVDAIPSGVFDFVMMDACFMGSVEFAYAMRGKTNYLIVSPAEVIAFGMPYDRIMKHIFADEPKLGKDGICQVYYDFYLKDYKLSSGDTPGNKFATIALYDCTKLEALAEAVRDIVLPRENEINVLTKSEIEQDIQTLDRYERRTMFDLKEFVEYLGIDPEDEVLARFEAALAAAIPYSGTTGKPIEASRNLAELTIPADRYCGASTYIPIGEYAALNAAYWQTEWARAVYQK